eukprot:CAMPEP_0113514934 /NCGR_PEP_ID=MMETSP0014_2-20120614/40673_1 /TAXON_ID=2857 /ORGANISM="Nitzschia sp." /LENGTH=649 /DNA_ID=CAMNT_0000411463 /DNA_START=338 /DNA_END=2287 /DNA_ORIENTATION=- /assembly_acc=CAM_ASM_000159
MVMSCTTEAASSSSSSRHDRTHCRRSSATTKIKQKGTRTSPPMISSQQKHPNAVGLVMSLVTTLQTMCLLLFLLGYFDTTTTTTTTTTSPTFGGGGGGGRGRVHAAPVYFRHKHKPRRSACETLMKSIPALSVYHYCVSKSKEGNDGDDDDRIGVLSAFQDRDNNNNVVEVTAVKKQKKKRKKKKKMGDDDEDETTEKRPNRPRRIKKILSATVGSSLKPIEGSGYYYGLTQKELKDGQNHHTTSSSNRHKKPQTKPKLQDSVSEAVEELKSLREDIERMRKEIKDMRVKILGDEADLDDGDEDSTDSSSGSTGGGAEALWQRREKQRKADKLAAQIEAWAQSMLQETEEDGWKPVECNKMVRSSLNASNRTVAHVKWMKDSREDLADANDEDLYPCMKCHATIDAPLEAVCSYLAEESVSPDYNDVVKKHHDVEEISPNAKVCWSQSPQILFIKPRDFVTFCYHRWRRDGTEVIVNQAYDHPDAKPSENSVRGYALRGANFISRSHDDPSKTEITIIAHANPGGGLPPWASKTAVNALAPIEPFKLFHKINEQVQKNQSELGERFRKAEMVSSVPPGRSRRPGGMAQLGYACYWPNGGGSVEKDTSITDTGSLMDDGSDDSDSSNINSHHGDEFDDDDDDEYSPSEQV